MSFNILPIVTAWPSLVGTIAVGQFLIILWLAFAVMKDARQRTVSKGGLFLDSPWLCFFVVLATGGYFGTLAYWLIHYSSFRFRHETGG